MWDSKKKLLYTIKSDQATNTALRVFISLSYDQGKLSDTGSYAKNSFHNHLCGQTIYTKAQSLRLQYLNFKLPECRYNHMFIFSRDITHAQLPTQRHTSTPNRGIHSSLISSHAFRSSTQNSIHLLNTHTQLLCNGTCI